MREPDGTLRHVGRVGSGLSEAELERLSALLEPLRREDTPFDSGAKVAAGGGVLRAEVVVEVRFTSWTRAGSLRHPTYLGLRSDRSASEVVREPAPWPAAGWQDGAGPPLAGVPADERQRAGQRSGPRAQPHEPDEGASIPPAASPRGS